MGIFSRKKDSSTPTPPPASHTAHAEPIDPQIDQLGRDMLHRARSHKAGILSAKFYSDKLMNWSMKDHDFKVQLFRFVDVFPMLTTPEMIHDHLVDYLSQPGVKVPTTIDVGLKAGGVAKGLMGRTIEGQIKGMAQKFIAGTDAASALPKLKKLWDDGIAFSVDLLGEACISDAEADAYRDKYLDLIENLPETVATWKPQPRLSTDHLGDISRTNVSIKISSLADKVDPIDPEASIKRLMVRLLPILETARDRGVFVNFDMEHHDFKDLTLTLFERCCEQIDFEAGLAMQAYLKSGDDDAKRICNWARAKNRIVTVRLVKGAYWDAETIHAEMENWPCPVWNEKHQTDACFERMSEIFLDATPRSTDQGGVKLALGSHNVRSIAAALAGLQRRDLPNNAIEIQMLHGMADQLKHAAGDMDLRVREYVPVGDMIPGMAYLVRRLLENTSNESWLKAGFMDDADPTQLLANPAHLNGTPNGSPTSQQPGVAGATGVAGVPPASNATTTPATPKPDLYTLAADRHQLSPAPKDVADSKPFVNAPIHDFSNKSKRTNFAHAIANVKVPHVANDNTPEQASKLLARAVELFPTWRDADPKARANVLVSLAKKMTARRDELSAVMIKEACKTWREADADTCEAIDFCEFYARCAPPLFERHRMGKFIGELDEHWHQPKGVAVVISPWNFPLAIATGMTAAAVVTGNTTILKPAEQTPGIAKLMTDMLRDALREANFDSDICQLCPAPGETTGAALVRDPRVNIIAFTGSKAVGLDIIQAAGVTHETQPFVKRVVCEMGGKNALIIDTSADLDEAVLGVRHSAFGFQGQKCSACSRVVVVDPEGPEGHHMKLFLERFTNAAQALVLGDPSHPDTDVAPVIDEQSAIKIRHYIDLAKQEGCTLELALDIPEDNPFVASSLRRFVAPHIFSGVTPEHSIAKDEIFGPVVAVMHAHNFDEALAIANNSQYKLTGGVYSRKPAHLEKAKREFRVGNLYLNRPITGAIVARHPFGGFAMSGVGSKAGGLEYLHQFVEPRACAENMMRRGFAPEL